MSYFPFYTNISNKTFLIIGGGPGGYVAAERAGAEGLSTVLFEHKSLVLVVYHHVIEAANYLHHERNLYALIGEGHVLAHAGTQILCLAYIYYFAFFVEVLVNTWAFR